MQQKEQNKKILIIGAAVINKVVHVNEFPSRGKDLAGLHKESVVTGSAYNVQQIVSKFDVKHTLLIPVEKGPYAEVIRNELQDKLIPELIQEDSMDNGWKITFVEVNGGRTIPRVPELEAKWKEEWFKEVTLAGYDLIYVSGYVLVGESGKVIVEQIRKGKRSDAKVIFDLSSRISSIDSEVLQQLFELDTIVHCNVSQLKVLYPGKAVREAAK